MWANVVSESDAYTHSIYSFILTNGGVDMVIIYGETQTALMDLTNTTI
jgi:hypothetical protein